MSDVSLVFALLAKDAASAVIDKVGGKLSGVGKAMVAAGAAIATGAFTGAKALFELGAEFDDAYDTIRTTTGKTGQALDALKDDFRAVVATVPTDFATAGQAIAELNQRTGATGPALQDLTARMLELSRLTGTELSANIAGITRVFGDWSISTNKQGGAMDAMFRASQATGASVTSLAEKVVQFGAPLRQLGFSFEQSVALLGKFEKEGVNTEIVLGAMRKGLAKFAKAGEDPAKALAAVELQIKKAGSAAQANKIAIEVFGAKAGPDMAAAVREGRFELGALFQTVTNGSDTIMKASSDTMDFSERWQIFKNNVLLKLEPLATKLFDAIGDGARRLIPAFQKASEFVQTTFIPAMRDLAAWFAEKFGPAARAVAELVRHLAVEGFGVAVDAVRVLAPLLAVLGGILINVVVPALTSVVSWIDENRKAIVIIAGVITAVFIPHWIALAVASTVNAAKVAAAFLVTKAGAIAAAAVHSFNILVMIGSWVILGVQSLIQAARVAAAWFIAMGPVGWLIGVIVALVALIIMNWDRIRQITEDVWGAVWGFIKMVGEAIWVLIQDKVQAILTVWNFLGELPVRIAAWLLKAHQWVSQRLGDIVRFFLDLPGRIVGGLGDLGSLLVDAGERIVMGLIRGIGNLAGKVWAKVTEIANGAMRAIQNALAIFSPSRRMQWVGEMVGRGLLAGLERMTGPVADAADQLGHSAMVTVPGPAMATAGAGTGRLGGAAGGVTSIEIRSGGSRLDDLLVELLKGAIRKRGGDPGVLGP